MLVLVCAVVLGGCGLDIEGVNSDDAPSRNNSSNGDVETLSVGTNFGCELRSDRGVQCWGDNSVGQLGDGGTRDSVAPVDVVGLSDVRQVSAGDSHACAVTGDGIVQCWGSNQYGQLGTAADGDVMAEPVRVEGLGTVELIDAGDSTTCALLRDDGSVWCWGTLPAPRRVDSPVPVRVPGLNDVRTLAVESGHSCALIGDGGVRCWGWNGKGDLGDGTTKDADVPVEVQGITDAVAISVSCAVLRDGGVKCWGYNLFGQLGDGTTKDSPIAVEVGGVRGAVQVSTGVSHSCARTSSEVFCWGSNEQGQLGATVPGLNSPTAVVMPTTAQVAAVEAGGFETCTLSDSGVAACLSTRSFRGPPPAPPEG